MDHSPAETTPAEIPAPTSCRHHRGRLGRVVASLALAGAALGAAAGPASAATSSGYSTTPTVPGASSTAAGAASSTTKSNLAGWYAGCDAFNVYVDVALTQPGAVYVEVGGGNALPNPAAGYTGAYAGFRFDLGTDAQPAKLHAFHFHSQDYGFYPWIYVQIHYQNADGTWGVLGNIKRVC